MDEPQALRFAANLMRTEAAAMPDGPMEATLLRGARWLTSRAETYEAAEREGKEE